MTLHSLLHSTYCSAIPPSEQEQHISDILQRHSQAFSHFITIHPRRPVHLEDMVTSIRDLCLLSIPATQPKRTARAFLSLSLAPRYRSLAPTTIGDLCEALAHSHTYDFTWWRRHALLKRARAWHHDTDAALFIAPWHFHAVAGSCDTTLHPHEIGRRMLSTLRTSHDMLSDASVDVKALTSLGGIRYAIAQTQGNFFSGFQFTNDTYVLSQCRKQCLGVEWCFPDRALLINRYKEG